MNNLRVRLAIDKDIMLLYRWANDPQTRAASFDQNPIPLDVHRKWFSKMLSSKACILIAEYLQHDAWEPIGQVRIDENNEIHIALDPEFRGKGLSSSVLKIALNYAKDKLSLKKVIAHIKPENKLSIKAFESAGFVFFKNTKFMGHECFEYVYNIE